MKCLRVFLVVGMAVAVVNPTVTFAQWTPNGTAVCEAAGNQTMPKLVLSDPAGMILAWRDQRNGFDWHIYARRVDSAGIPLWNPDGNLVSANGGLPAAVHYGESGVLIGFNGYGGATGFDVFAQGVDVDGNLLWTPADVTVCSDFGSQWAPTVIADGFGGAIFAWEDERSGTSADIYAQRVDGSGTPLWTSNGVLVCGAPYAQSNVTVAQDGTGGVIVVWEDGRDNDPFDSDVFAQRIDADGIPAWQPDGVEVGDPDVYGQSFPIVIADGSGGAILAWMEEGDIYAQRINSSGDGIWNDYGLVVCQALGSQVYPVAGPDGLGGVIIAWEDARTGSLNKDVFAQRIDASGTPLWTTNGVAVCTASGNQNQLSMAPNGTGGAVVAWRDYRSGIDTDVYAQRIDGEGNATWGENGVAVCTEIADQLTPVIMANGSNSAIVAWEDRRTGNADIYVQRVPESTTAIGPAPSPEPVMLPNHPNPFTSSTWVEFSLPSESDVEMYVYDVLGREVFRTSLGRHPVGSRSIQVEPVTGDGRPLPSGVYFYSLRAAGWTATRKMVIMH